MKYVCIYCGNGGASAHDDPHPPLSYNCLMCTSEHAANGSMWPAEHANLFRATMAAYKRANKAAHHKPLTVYLADGFMMKVPYSPELMAFTHNDMQIRNPWLSECGRICVDPKVYGFEPWDGGGGSVALYLQRDQGRYMLFTDSSGLELPDASGDDLLGLYTEDGDGVAVIRVGDIPLDSEE